MQTINISLPDQLKDFVEGQVGSGRYGSVSEYVRDLIRDDERRKAQERLEALLVEGIQSGEATEMTRQDWSDIRTEALNSYRLKAGLFYLPLKDGIELVRVVHGNRDLERLLMKDFSDDAHLNCAFTVQNCGSTEMLLSCPVINSPPTGSVRTRAAGQGVPARPDTADLRGAWGCDCAGLGITGPCSLLLSAQPILAPAKLAQCIKGRSSRHLQAEFPELRKQYPGSAHGRAVDEAKVSVALGKASRACSPETARDLAARHHLALLLKTLKPRGVRPAR